MSTNAAEFLEYAIMFGLYPPTVTPATFDYITTEDGDRITTQDDQEIITEGPI